MALFALRRLVLAVPLLIGITFISFLVIQLAPGGPVDLMLARIQGTGLSAEARLSGAASGEMARPAPAPGGANPASISIQIYAIRFTGSPPR